MHAWMQEVLWTFVGLVDAAVSGGGQLKNPQELLNTLVPLQFVSGARAGGDVCRGSGSGLNVDTDHHSIAGEAYCET